MFGLACARASVLMAVVICHLIQIEQQQQHKANHRYQ